MKKIFLLIFTFSFICLQIQAQYSLTGKVLDKETGEALSEVSILVKDTKLGTTSDVKGNFNIHRIQPKEITLIFSHVGYVRETVLVDFTNQTKQHLEISLLPAVIDLDQTIVTATRTEEQITKLPVRAAVISQEEIDDYPSLTVDDLLRNVAGVVVNRSWGIFSKNSSITMRGLDGSARTLILIDGVPINKTAGGSVTWEMVKPEQIEKIEVVKGPNSALYGNNAMAGTINIRTRKPERGTHALAKTFYGSYNTYGGLLQASHNNIEKDRGFYVGVNGGYRQGDGYIIEPPETRDTNNSEAYLEEYNSREVIGYQFNKNQQIELEHIYYNGKHGAGRQIFEEDGSYDHYRINLASLKYTGKIGNVKLRTRLFYQQEDYTKQRESMNSIGKYKLRETFSLKKDYGIWTSATWNPFSNQEVTFGFDFKQGYLDAETIYRTSTDVLFNGGDLRFYGFFAQDKISLWKNKLTAIAGLRIDFAEFYNGALNVENPTNNTGFIDDYKNDFADHSWNNISPKLALMYNFSEKLNTFISASTGFMPPKLDDLTRSGKITKGFKLANPLLKPETITSYEWGWNYTPADRLKFEPSVYYSLGKDFQYFVGTGDSIDTGGQNLKPELQRQNISEVEIYGFEMTMTWNVMKNLMLNTNYSYSHSEITKFEADPETNKDLTGKHLIEVPDHMAGAMLFWRNKYVNTTLVWTFMGSQWYDDENTRKIDGFHLFDIELSRDLGKNFEVSLIVQDLFDKVFIDRKGRLSPGRFVLGELTFKI